MRKAAVSRLRRRRRRPTTHNSTLSLSLSRALIASNNPCLTGMKCLYTNSIYVKAKYKRSTYRTLRAQKIPHAMQASVCARVVDYEKYFLSMQRS